ncbi:MAG: hypothetical protein QM784_05815 [Polyangiaceae bacterium]
MKSESARAAPRRELELARRELVKLGREGLPLGRALAALSRGMLQMLEGNGVAARVDFDEAHGWFALLQMRLFAHACRWASHCAEPAGDMSVGPSIQAAMMTLGVVSPVRMMGLLLPALTLPVEVIHADDPLMRVLARGAGKSTWEDPSSCDTTLGSA